LVSPFFFFFFFINKKAHQRKYPGVLRKYGTGAMWRSQKGTSKANN
jgi:hypothetical protein